MAVVSLDEYKKALQSLEESLGLYEKSGEGSAEQRAFRDTCIQRFEFCIELSWKVSKKIMGSSSVAPKTIVREMAQEGLIKSPGEWLDFVDARNKSSHTYDEDIAKEVFKVVRSFYPQGKMLLSELSQK